MSLPHIIALYSPAPQQGKTTLSNFLRDELGYQPVKFAGPLKTMLGALLLQTPEAHPYAPDASPAELREMTKARLYAWLEGDHKEQPIASLGNWSPRELLQTLGTKWGREMVADSLWVDLTIEKVHDLLTEGHRVVIDDMRFPNEYAALAGPFEPMLVRVTCDDYQPEEDPATAEALLEHPECVWDAQLCAPRGAVTVLQARMLEALRDWHVEQSEAV